MLRSIRIHKSIAVLLVLMVFVAMANAFVSDRTGHASSGPVVAGAVFGAIPPASSVPDKEDFKPPKHSFVDYDIFFSCVAMKPMNRQVAQLAAPAPGNGAPAETFSEILIPPKI